MYLENDSPEVLAIAVQGGLIRLVQSPIFPVVVDHVECFGMNIEVGADEVVYRFNSDILENHFVIVGGSGQRIKVTVEPEVTT